MKQINSFAQKALVLLALFAIATIFIPKVFADDEGYSGESYSPDSYSYDTTDYSGEAYSPDTYSYDSGYSGEAYSPDTYSYDNYDYSGEAYSPDTYSYDSYTPSYDYSSYDTGASYTTGASYSAPVYTSASYSAPVYTAPVYTAPVYTAPVYTPPTYTPPVVINNPPVVVQNNLQASCYAQNSNVNEGQNVTWVANASGGNGGYTYTWGGTNLNGQHGSSVTTSYNSPGNYTATVSVYSNGQTINVNCGSINVIQQQTVVNNITASCYANVSSAVVGSTVTWTAIVNGGNGNYQYSWSDNNGVNTQNSTGPTFTTTYPIAGTKSPTLHVSSLGSYGYGYNNNGSITVTCRPIGVNSYNAGYTTTYTTPSAPLASLTSVSLNQVPYTGLTDSAGFWEFMLGLFLASLAGTWYFMKVYARGKQRYMINLFKKDNLAKKMVA